MATRSEIAKSVAVLASASRADVDEAMLESFAIVLRPVPRDVLMKAVAIAIKEDSHFLKTPGELLAICRRIAHTEVRAAVAAWEEYKNFGRGNVLALAIVSRLNCDEHSPEFYDKGRKHFVQSYASALRRNNGSVQAAIMDVKLKAIGQGELK